MKFDPTEFPHRRYNPLTGNWILVSPHRSKRPWQGQDEPPPADKRLSYNANCYLCPGNPRISGEQNPHYSSTYVFQNDFSALLPQGCDQPEQGYSSPLLRAQAVTGLSGVICFSPDHGKTLPELSLPQLRAIIDTWAIQAQELGQRYLWVQLFENKGEAMGCSQPHPHGQIWASDFLPNEIAQEQQYLLQYQQQQGSNLLLDYLHTELADGSRTVVETPHWLAVVPYWATWPFETLLLPKRHIQRMEEMSSNERDCLALALQKLTSRYDNLFHCSFPYSMGWHFAPYFKQGESREQWQLHAHFYPPLLRSATVRKFMVGYEMLAEAQRDLTAEQAAQRLRQVSDIHYSLEEPL